MPENSTSFDTGKHHIHLELIVTDLNGIWHSVAGILDTGAPRTEFSDQFLMHAGFIDIKNENARLKPGLQTQKYGTIEFHSRYVVIRSDLLKFTFLILNNPGVLTP